MKKLMIAFVVGLAALGQSRMALAQDEMATDILYGPLVGIEEQTGFGSAQAVFRGGQTILTWALYSPCSTAVFSCVSLMHAGQMARLVAVSDSGARTLLDRQAIQVDATSPLPYVTKRVTFQSNIIEQLVSGVVVIELEADATVVAAGPMLRVKTYLAGPRPSGISLLKGSQ